MIRALALLVSLQSGCLFFDTTASVETACFNLCDCREATPTAQDFCATDCVEVIGDTAPQECLDCVAAASCEELEEDLTCLAECQGDANRILEE